MGKLITLLIFLLILISSASAQLQAITKKDYLEFLKSEVSFDYACSYYKAKNPLQVAFNFAGQNSLDVLSWQEVYGRKINPEWQYKNIVKKKKQVWQSNFTCIEQVVWNEKNQTNQTIYNCTDNGYYKTVTYNEINWLPLSELNLQAKATKDVRICAKIQREWIDGSYKVAIDHIPKFAGYTYPEYAWWNSSYTYKRNITNEITSNLAFAVNGTNGFCGNIIWTNPLPGDLEIYYNNCSDYSIANQTAGVPFETEGGSISSTIYSPESLRIFHLGRGTGNITIDSFNQQNGTIYNLGSTINWTTGIYSNGLFISDPNQDISTGASNGLILLPDFMDTTPNNISISFWVKLGGNAQKGVANYFFWKSNIGDSDRMGIALNNDTAFRFLTEQGNAGINQIFSSDISLNAWHHLVFIWSTDKGKEIWIDGQLDVSDNTQTTLMADGTYSDFSIGGYISSTGAHYYTLHNTTIDEIRIYNKTLATTEIQELYNNSQNLNLLLGEEQVGNSAPNGTAFNLTPSTAYASTDLSFNITVTDADNDTMNITTYWYKNGVNVYNQTNLSITNGTILNFILDSGNFSKNDLINATVSITDGTETTNVTSSNTITILNSAPALSNLKPLNSSTISSTSYNFSWTGTDIDDDNLTYLAYLSENLGPYQLIYNGSNSYKQWNELQNDADYRWYVIADDGSATTNSGTYHFSVSQSSSGGGGASASLQTDVLPASAIEEPAEERSFVEEVLNETLHGSSRIGSLIIPNILITVAFMFLAFTISLSQKNKLLWLLLTVPMSMIMSYGLITAL